MGPALLAWLSAALCVALAWRKRRLLERLAPPTRQELLAELSAGAGNPNHLVDAEQRLAIAELNQRLSDVSFELDLTPATYAALIRISWASGSALGLVGFVTASQEAALTRTLRLAIAALAGLSGAAATALVGRAAKARARQIRNDWDSSSRDIGKALGTSLAAAEGIRGNRFPE